MRVPRFRMCDDEIPFNPFYIGPNPELACAPPEIAPRLCCPGMDDTQVDCTSKPPNQLVAATIEVTETPKKICRPYPCNKADRME